MDYRRFGNTSLRVSEIGVGCSRLGGRVEDNNDREVLSTLLEAFERGINFYDTADAYTLGRSESLLGEAFKHKRSAVIFATKAGYCLAAAQSFGARLMPLLRPVIRPLAKFKNRVQRARTAQKNQSFSPDHLKRSIEASLRRLQTDYLDIFQLHSPPSQIIENGEYIATLEHAKSQGKIRWYGVSCRTIEDAVLCLSYPGISSVQIPINLLEFKGVASFLALAKQKNVAVIARQPLASGYLARPTALIKPDHFSEKREEFEEKIAQARGYQFLQQVGSRTIAQAALKFVLSLPAVSVVIPGMSNREHLEENLSAAAYSFTQDEIAKIYAAAGHHESVEA